MKGYEVLGVSPSDFMDSDGNVCPASIADAIYAFCREYPVAAQCRTHAGDRAGAPMKGSEGKANVLAAVAKNKNGKEGA